MGRESTIVTYNVGTVCLLIFLWFVLVVGDPDLLDALVKLVLKLSE